MGRPNRFSLPGLSKSKDGRYRFDYKFRDPSGIQQRVQRTFPKGLPAAAAKRRAALLLEECEALRCGVQKRKVVALHTLLDEYVAGAQVQDLKSSKSVESRVRTLKAFIPDLPLPDMTPACVDDFRTAYAASGVSPASINRAMATWKRAIRYARRHDLLSADLGERLRDVQKLREPQGRVKWLEPEEHDRLFAQLSGDLLDLVRVAHSTGMRKGEILRLRGEHLLTTGRIFVDETKTNRSRSVEPDSAVWAMLLARATTPDALLFPRRGGPICGTWVSKAFRRAAERAKIVDFHFHDLRHDLATRLRRAGVSLATIAEILGHSSLDMTRRYAHIDPDQSATALRTVKRVLPTPGVRDPAAGHDDDSDQNVSV
ncbi:MAG: tyrosine-type recombinase/integrase [Polyangiales bacterium]